MDVLIFYISYPFYLGSSKYSSIFVFGEVLVSLSYILLPLILGYLHAKIDGRKMVHKIFQYYLFISVGIQGILTGFMQMTAPEIVADYVQWPNSPFLLELGMANASYGILGILSLWLNQGWKAATAIGYSLFLLFTGIGHFVNILISGIAPGDGGSFLWSDLLVPVMLFIFLSLNSKHEVKASS